MSDLNLNPLLGARLKAVQIAWGHDSPSETLATILDATMHGWNISCPQTSNVVCDSGYRVRLKTRHESYFAQLSQVSGCSVSELARSFLIKWLCVLPQSVTSQESKQLLPVSTQKSPKQTQKAQCKTQKLPKSTRTTTQETQTEVNPTPPTPQPTPKMNGRAMLQGLLT